MSSIIPRIPLCAWIPDLIQTLYLQRSSSAIFATKWTKWQRFYDCRGYFHSFGKGLITDCRYRYKTWFATVIYEFTPVLIPGVKTLIRCYIIYLCHIVPYNDGTRLGSQTLPHAVEETEHASTKPEPGIAVFARKMYISTTFLSPNATVSPLLKLKLFCTVSERSCSHYNRSQFVLAQKRVTVSCEQGLRLVQTADRVDRRST